MLHFILLCITFMKLKNFIPHGFICDFSFVRMMMKDVPIFIIIKFLIDIRMETEFLKI